MKHNKSLGIDWSHLSSTKQQVKVRNASKRKNGGDKKTFKRIKPSYPRDSPVRRKPLAAVNKQAAKVCIDMTVESPEFSPTSTKSARICQDDISVYRDFTQTEEPDEKIRDILVGFTTVDAALADHYSAN